MCQYNSVTSIDREIDDVQEITRFRGCLFFGKKYPKNKPNFLLKNCESIEKTGRRGLLKENRVLSCFFCHLLNAEIERRDKEIKNTLFGIKEGFG